MFVDIRNILLPLNGVTSPRSIMETALLYAERFHARLSTVLMDNTPDQLISLAGEGLATGIVNDMIDNAINQTQERLRHIHACFTTLATEEQHQWYDLSSTTSALPPPLAKTTKPQTTFELVDDTARNAIITRSRLADMTIVPHLSSNRDPSASDILHTILFDSGRPLVIAPPSPPSHIGQHVAIAWNGTAEASVALRCVLPWACTAESVTLLHNDHYQHMGPDVKAVQTYLALHDIHANIRSFQSEKNTVGTALLKAAHDCGADMLAMGAYSHSRFRQMILGGVTRHILDHADITVLMSR